MRRLLKKNNLLLILILLFSAFLRLYKVADYMTFLGDEGRDVLVVYNILHGKLTFLGPTASVGGFFLGPIYYYFMTPFLLLFDYNPIGPAVMVGLFGTATVFLVYKIGSEFFDKKTGLIAALLYSISPLVVAYSRSSWNPNLMPFFSLLALYILYKGIRKNSWKLFIVTGILFGILMQLHYLATFLGIIIILYITTVKIITFKKFLTFSFGTLKAYFSIFLGFLIGWSPFLIFEIRHGFPNITSVINFVFHSSDTGGNSQFFATIGDVFFRLFGRLIVKYPPAEQVSAYPTTLIDLHFFSFKFPVIYLYLFTLALALSSLGFFAVRYIKSIKEKGENFQKLNLLFVWFIVGILLFGFYKKSIYDYYLGFLFPLPFLFIGNLASFLMDKKYGKILGGVVLFFLVVLNLTGIPFRYAPNRQLAQVEEISKFVFEKTQNKPFNFALITGGNSDHAYRYFFKLWRKDPIIIQNVENDPKRTTVTDQLLVICEKIPCEPLGNPLWEIAGFGRAEIAGKWDVSVVEVYKLTPYKGK